MSGEDVRVTEAEEKAAKELVRHWWKYGGDEADLEDRIARALARSRREERERIIKLIHADLLNPATAKCLEDAIRKQAEDRLSQRVAELQVAKSGREQTAKARVRALVEACVQARGCLRMVASDDVAEHGKVLGDAEAALEALDAALGTAAETAHGD